MDIGGCHFNCVDKPTVLINSNMGFVAKMPRVALLYLMGLRVTLLFLILCGGRGGDDSGVHNSPLFQQQPLLLQQSDYLRKQLLLQAIVHENITKAAQRIAVRHLVAGIHTAEVRKSTAVDCLGNRRFVGQVIKVLQQIQPQHQFQVVGLISALSFIIARLDHGYPFAQRNNALDLLEKFFFLCPHLRQFVIQSGQTHLFIHIYILPLGATFCTRFSVRCCPTTSASYNEADSVDVYDETSTVITGLKNGTKYYFVVKAVHDIYLSPGSNEVSATPTSGNGGGSSISPDTGSQITVSTTDDSTSVTGTLTRVNGGTQIDIKNRAFDKLDAADKPVSINARIATVTFDKKAMDAIGTESGDEDVTITARQVSASELSRKERALVGSRPVYDFTVTGGGKTISSFGGGYATVSIPYTLLPGENPQAVVIWYLSDSGTLESVRGCYDAATKTVTFVTPHFSRFVIGYNLVAFSDITSSAWYYDAVTFLAARGVTTGTTAATFSPDDTLTRGQFIVMLLRAYGIESDSTAAHNFSDSGNTYYTGYLAAAKRLGITNGVGNNRFAPEQSITRQEMFTLLYNALRVIGAPPSSTAGRTLTDFSDASAIAPWAKDAMTLLVESGTVSGSGGKLNPTGITTRGEMAQVLYNLLSK